MECYLIIRIAVCETGCGPIVSTSAPFDVEGAIGSYAAGQREDTVIARCSGDLIHRVREDREGRRSVRETSCIEEIISRTKAQVAVGTGQGRVKGIAVERDREWYRNSSVAVVAVVADIGHTRYDRTRPVRNAVTIGVTSRRCRRSCRRGCRGSRCESGRCSRRRGLRCSCRRSLRRG